MATFGCLVSFVYLPHSLGSIHSLGWPLTVNCQGRGLENEAFGYPKSASVHGEAYWESFWVSGCIRVVLRIYAWVPGALCWSTGNISSMKMDVQNMVAAMTKFLGSRNQCQWPIMAPWSWTQATHLSHHCSWTKHVETALNMHTHTHRKLSGKHGFRMHARLCLLSVWWGCLLFPFSAGFLSIIPWGLALWALAPTRMSNGSSLRLRHVSEMFLSCDDKHEKISSRKWAGV